MMIQNASQEQQNKTKVRNAGNKKSSKQIKDDT